MKLLWSIVALLLLVGLIVLLQPPRNDTPGRALDREFTEAMENRAAPALEMPATSAGSAEPERPTAAAVTKESGPAAPNAANGAVSNDANPASATAPSERPITPIAGIDPVTPESPAAAPESRTPSGAPQPAKVAAAGDATQFEPAIPEIPFAEILPSTFRRLPDGTISADDAWTIGGDGTEASPYEVSWEFLASAQDSYVPRLSENKIPARIAFLSGKRLRISGYLAFPLVAQTSGECLIMLNQWDGCCIGIPPTPYDAIEVKLQEPISGWRKHTYSFGSIEGTFTIEPYLVENWLVGLYMLKDAKLKRDL